MTAAFIFDFDGTLVDSEQAIYQCFHSITKQLAPERIAHAKNILIGPPLRDTASKILGPENQNLVDEFVSSFIKMHDEQAIKHSRPYPGVTKILRFLYEKKIPMALATNKRKVPTLLLINHYGWEDYFTSIHCSDDFVKITKKEVMIKNIIDSDQNFKNGYFVGDTLNDAISAEKNNIKFIRANYGYGVKQDWSSMKIYDEIDNFEDLVTL